MYIKLQVLLGMGLARFMLIRTLRMILQLIHQVIAVIKIIKL